MPRRFAPLALAALPLALLAQPATGDFGFGDFTLPEDCAELRPRSQDDAPPPERNAFALLNKITLPKLGPGEKTFVELDVSEAADPAHRTSNRARKLMIPYAEALADWDAALAAPAYEEPATTSFDQTLLPDHLPRFLLIRELTLAHLRRIRLTQEDGHTAEAFTDWLTLHDALARFSENNRTLVASMVWSTMRTRCNRDLWRLTPTREQSLRLNRRKNPDHETVPGKRTMLGETAFYLLCEPRTDAQIQTVLDRPGDTYSGNGIHTVADYRRLATPHFGHPTERAREALAEWRRLTAPGAESPAVFTQRLGADTPFSRRFKQLSKFMGADDPINPFEMAYFTTLNTRTTRILGDVTVALRAYAGEHGGRYPARLDELVPAYLDALPRDPFDGAPLRYDPVRPAVWSIGPDGRDDSGTVETVSPRLLRHKGDIVSTPAAGLTPPAAGRA